MVDRRCTGGKGLGVRAIRFGVFLVCLGLLVCFDFLCVCVVFVFCLLGRFLLLVCSFVLYSIKVSFLTW